MRIIVFVKSIDGGTGTFVFNFLEITRLFKKDPLLIKTLVLERPAFRKVDGKKFSFFASEKYYPEKYTLLTTNPIVFLREIVWARKQVEKYDPDLVITIDAHCLMLAQTLKIFRRKKFKIIANIHNNLTEVVSVKSSFYFHLPLRYILKYFLNKADVVISVSKKLSSDLQKSFKLNRIPKTLYLGMHLPTQPYPINFNQNKPKIILSIARLSPQKDHETLLRSFARLYSELPETNLLIVGDGPLKRVLQSLAIELGIENKVKFFGWAQNVFQLILKADIFVLSSKREGLPWVLIEAMAYGKPTIATDSPFGPREILGNGKYGIITPVGNTEALARAMRALLTKRALYLHYSKKARQRSKFFSLERTLTGYKELILGLSNTRRNILVLTEIHDGGEWIAVKRLIRAVHQYSSSFCKFSLLGIGNSKNPGLNFIKQKALVRYSYAKKPFSFIKKLVKDISNIRAGIQKVGGILHPSHILITNFLMVPALLFSSLKNKGYIYYFSGVKTPWNKNYLQLSYRQVIVRFLETLALLFSSAILIPSKCAASHAGRLLGIWASRKIYIVVPNYVPSEFFTNNVKGRKSNKPYIILYSGRIAKFKGLENLLDAFSLFNKVNGDTLLFLAYPSSNIDREVFRALKQKVAGQKLQGSVRFIPDSTTVKLITLYREAQVLVLPSEIELAPLSILEAMAAGTPVLATDVGNIKEIVSKIDSHLVLKDNNVRTIRKGLEYFFSLPPERVIGLREKSIEVAGEYSEGKTAEAFLQAVNHLKT